MTPIVPTRPFQWVLLGSIIAQLVLSLMLATGNYDALPDMVRRDIYLVAGVGAVLALAMSVTVVYSVESKRAAWVMIALAAALLLLLLFAVVMQTLTGWVLIPGFVMVVGLIMFFRDPEAALLGQRP